MKTELLGGKKNIIIGSLLLVVGLILFSFSFFIGLIYLIISIALISKYNKKDEIDNRAIVEKEIMDEAKKLGLVEETRPKKQIAPLTPIKEITPINTSIKENKNMVFIKGGKFEMGYLSNSKGDPAHKVTLDDFYINKYQVTHAEFVEFLNINEIAKNGVYNGNLLIDLKAQFATIVYRNGKFNFVKGKYAEKDSCPVVLVTWAGAHEYCKWAGGRLPSEAEWEYAARGGTKYDETYNWYSMDRYRFSGSDDINEVAWYWRNSGDYRLKGDWAESRAKDNNGRTHPVGAMKKNQLGLYDMSGNVWEWCNDWYARYETGEVTNPQGPETGGTLLGNVMVIKPMKVIRGGSWYNDSSCETTARESKIPTESGYGVGFRLGASVER